MMYNNQAINKDDKSGISDEAQIFLLTLKESREDNKSRIISILKEHPEAFNLITIPVDDDMYAEDSPLLYDPENLISCSIASHNYIHYGKWPDEPLNPIRRPGDTKLW